jgi:hypothetical protein
MMIHRLFLMLAAVASVALACPQHAWAQGSVSQSKSKTAKVDADIITLPVASIGLAVTTQINRVRTAIAKDASMPAADKARLLGRISGVLGKVQGRLAVLRRTSPQMTLKAMAKDIGTILLTVEKEVCAQRLKSGLKSCDWPTIRPGFFADGLSSFRPQLSDDESDSCCPDEEPDQQDGDDEDSSEVDMDEVADLDQESLSDAVDSLADLQLDNAQRDKLRQLRRDEQSASQASRARMKIAAAGLRTELAKPSPDGNLVNRLVDQISAEQGVQQKAQLKALLGAKALLRAEQRRKVQASVNKNNR